MYIVTSNEKNSLSSRQRRDDVRDIYSAQPQRPIVLWQEIREVTDHEDIKAMAPGSTYHAFSDIPIPVSVPARYDVLEERYFQTKMWTGKTESSEGLGPVGDQPRWYGVLKLKDIAKPASNSFYVINTHFTNGCEWDSESPSVVALTLRPYWMAHWDMLDREIDHLKTEGHTIFWGGDFNRRDVPPFAKYEEIAIGVNKIDKLVVLDRSVVTEFQNSGTILTNSDHNAQWAQWKLTNK